MTSILDSPSLFSHSFATNAHSLSAVRQALGLPELVRAVIQFLERPADVLACAQVNRTWNLEALPILWRGAIQLMRCLGDGSHLFTGAFRNLRADVMWSLVQRLGPEEAYNKYFRHVKVYCPHFTKSNGAGLKPLLESRALERMSPNVMHLWTDHDVDFATSLLSPRLQYLFLNATRAHSFVQQFLQNVATRCPNLRYFSTGYTGADPNCKWRAQDLLDTLRNLPKVTHLELYGLYSELEDPSSMANFFLHLATERPNLQLLKMEIPSRCSSALEAKRKTFNERASNTFPRLQSLALLCPDGAPPVVTQGVIPRAQSLRALEYQCDGAPALHLLELLPRLTACTSLEDLSLIQAPCSNILMHDPDALQKLLVHLAAATPLMRRFHLGLEWLTGLAAHVHQHERPKVESLGSTVDWLRYWPQLQQLRMGSFVRTTFDMNEMARSGCRWDDLTSVQLDSGNLALPASSYLKAHNFTLPSLRWLHVFGLPGTEHAPRRHWSKSLCVSIAESLYRSVAPALDVFAVRAGCDMETPKTEMPEHFGTGYGCCPHGDKRRLDGLKSPTYHHHWAGVALEEVRGLIESILDD
ncbi:MAG: hypothetical protein Q9159_003827 [Coniocarpon cinnabarinum]